jgi:hypothetical protein
MAERPRVFHSPVDRGIRKRECLNPQSGCEHKAFWGVSPRIMHREFIEPAGVGERANA